eukprot:gene15136-624_t
MAAFPVAPAIACIVLLLALAIFVQTPTYKYKKKKNKNILGKTERPSVVFIGDSLMRYQYLSLANFWTHGTWIDPVSKPNLVHERDFSSWNNFYNSTTQSFKGYEICDCFRAEEYNLKTITENRYLHTPNHSLVYIQAFGKIPSHGHWKPDALPSTATIHVEHARHLWESDWEDTISNHIARLRPKPVWIVLNAGLWGNDFHDHAFRTRVLKAIADAGIKSVWKTTTHQLASRSRQRRYLRNKQYIDETDAIMCKLTTLCLNLNWTATADDSLYWDDVHFREPVYRQMNEQLLDLLRIPRGNIPYANTSSKQEKNIREPTIRDGF